ncbi:MAG: hypothetical protein IPN18_14550 [Ignavibacteriales bacterium]|nr:hypothetical protein [Ignavibacteriales bacterium]
MFSPIRRWRSCCNCSTAETIHTVNCGENILMVFVNNAIYGMTRDRWPHITIGMKTATSPYGRDAASMGNPIKDYRTVSHSCRGILWLATPCIPKRLRGINKRFQKCV